jgi:ferredoxin
MGFFTDTTVCIGCKACEVACKEWNQLPAASGGVPALSGDSYDNTRRLDGIHWRHVKFIEQFTPDRGEGRWLLMSDVCKHCVRAGCLEVCPTGAIIRTEFDTVVIQSDVCNVVQLHGRGEKRAYLYGADEKMLGGLNSFFLLVDRPEVYGLPPDPQMPTRNLASGSLWTALGAVVLGLAGLFNFRGRRARADTAREREAA